MSSRSRRVYLPREEWRKLGARRRREVARCARRLTPHPDPYVAAVAWAWANQMVPPVSARRPRKVLRFAWLAACLGAATVVGAALGDVGYLLIPGRGEWRERRLARHMLAADRPAS